MDTPERSEKEGIEEEIKLKFQELIAELKFEGNEALQSARTIAIKAIEGLDREDEAFFGQINEALAGYNEVSDDLDTCPTQELRVGVQLGRISILFEGGFVKDCIDELDQSIQQLDGENRGDLADKVRGLVALLGSLDASKPSEG